MFFQLTYISTANPLITGDEILAIMKSAYSNNKIQGITGITLYKKGKFLQIIEGEKETVNLLFSLIYVDPRHTNITPIMERQISKREFFYWSMGIKDLEGFNFHSIEGYNPIFEEPLDVQTFVNKDSHTLAFIRAFKKYP